MKLFLVTQGSALKLARNPGLEVVNAFGVLQFCINQFVDYSSMSLLPKGRSEVFSVLTSPLVAFFEDSPIEGRTVS